MSTALHEAPYLSDPPQMKVNQICYCRLLLCSLHLLGGLNMIMMRLSLMVLVGSVLMSILQSQPQCKVRSGMEMLLVIQSGNQTEGGRRGWKLR